MIDVVAASVGPWDRLLYSGGWDVGLRLPAALGVEGAGRVAAVGPAVTAAELVRSGGRLCSITSDAPASTAALSTADIYVSPDAKALAFLAARLLDDTLDQPARTLPLDEGPAAFDQSVHGRTGGSKLVLRVAGSAAG